MTRDKQSPSTSSFIPTVIYYALVAILYPAMFFTRINSLEMASSILIPFFVTLVFIAVLCTSIQKKDKSSRVKTAAFFCIMAGDYVINLSPFVETSAIFFSLAHILLGLYFSINNAWQKKDLLLLIPVVTASSTFYLYNLSSISETILKVMLIIYLPILSFMLWRGLCYAWSTASLKSKMCIIMGSSLFYATDLFVCSLQIYQNRIYIAAIWLCYPVSLFLLSVSDFLNHQCFRE